MSSCDQAGFGADALYCENRTVPSNYTIGAPAPAASWKACAQLCSADPKCKAYTYTPSKKQCAKKSSRQFIYQPGLQSGPVLSPRVWWMPPCTAAAQTAELYKCNASIPSTANIGTPVFKSTWNACQAMCTSDAKCKGWTWNPKGMCQKKNDATMAYNLFYLSGARTSGSTSGSGSSGESGGGSSGTSTDSSASKTPTPAPAETPAPTSPPATDWWRAVSPLGVEWWVVLVAGLVLLLLVGAVGMMAMMSMSG